MVLKVDAVVKRYGDTLALDRVSLDVKSGSAVAVVGPNGAGKSTLMNLLTGILPPDSGDIRLAGRSPFDPSARTALGYVPQVRSLYPSLSARENLDFFARLAGVRANARKAAVARQLVNAGLEETADHPRVRQFSIGMAQRLHVVCAFVHEPALVLLDEPTAGVDVQSRGRIVSMIEDYRTRGGTVLLTSHLLEECERLCDFVYVIDHGRVVAEGVLVEIVRRFASKVIRVEAASPEQVQRILGDRDGLSVGGRDGSTTITLRGCLEPSSVVVDLEAAGVPVGECHLSEGSLEEAFLALTGTSLRD